MDFMNSFSNPGFVCRNSLMNSIPTIDPVVDMDSTRTNNVKELDMMNG